MRNKNNFPLDNFIKGKILKNLKDEKKKIR